MKRGAGNANRSADTSKKAGNMYYEEAIIDGVLHIRSTPNGEWRKLSAEAITLKYMEVKREAVQQNAHLTLGSLTVFCVCCGGKVTHPVCVDCLPSPAQVA